MTVGARRASARFTGQLGNHPGATVAPRGVGGRWGGATNDSETSAPARREKEASVSCEEEKKVEVEACYIIIAILLTLSRRGDARDSWPGRAGGLFDGRRIGARRTLLLCCFI